MSFIPTFTKQKVVDKDGYFTPEMHQFFDVFFQQAQNNLSNEGLVVPGQSTSDITNINNPSNPNAKGPGTLLYDNETNTLKVNLNGIVKTVMTS